MKKVALFLVMLMGILFTASAFAQSPVVSASPVPVVSASAAPAASLSFVDFVKAHLAALALVVYAVLDVAIIAIPSLAGNGLAHQILLLAAKLAGQNPPA